VQHSDQYDEIKAERESKGRNSSLRQHNLTQKKSPTRLPELKVEMLRKSSLGTSPLGYKQSKGLNSAFPTEIGLSPM